jgi:hypothetical protein
LKQSRDVLVENVGVGVVVDKSGGIVVGGGVVTIISVNGLFDTLGEVSMKITSPKIVVGMINGGGIGVVGDGVGMQGLHALRGGIGTIRVVDDVGVVLMGGSVVEEVVDVVSVVEVVEVVSVVEEVGSSSPT